VAAAFGLGAVLPPEPPSWWHKGAATETLTMADGPAIAVAQDTSSYRITCAGSQCTYTPPTDRRKTK
jgi:hypothetical protein